MAATTSPVLSEFGPVSQYIPTKLRLTPYPVPVADSNDGEVSSVLKWAGGKSWLVPRLRELYEPYRERRLVDMFAGGLSVTIGLAPYHAIVNDINEHVIYLYRWLRVGFAAPGFSIESVPLINSEEMYYRNRTRFNELIELGQHKEPEAALLFWYLNRTCYNGLCRFNSSGFFNSPYGRYAKIDYRKLMDRFPAYQVGLKNYLFYSRDFMKVPLLPRDFIYADPPYDSLPKEPKEGEKPKRKRKQKDGEGEPKGAGFVGYSAGGFGWDQQVKLATLLSRHAGPVVASNAATPRIVELYESKGFHLEYVDAPRRIACTGDRTPAREILATKGL